MPGLLFDQEYCVFCYSLYLAFFSHTGILIVILIFPSINKKAGIFRQSVAVLLTPFIAAGIAFGGHQDLAGILMNIKVPRMRDMRFLPGTTEIWRFLSNKYGYTYDSLKVLIPTVSGLLLGLFILLVTAGIILLYFRKKENHPGWGYLSMIILMAVGVLLTPTLALGGGNKEQDCGDVIQAYEDAGNHLRSLIPEGSLVYWYGGLSPVPLLYLPEIRIYPPQLNDGYSYRIGGDTEQLYRNGFWNETLSDRWMLEADYILLEGRYYKDKTREKLEKRTLSRASQSD